MLLFTVQKLLWSFHTPSCCLVCVLFTSNHCQRRLS
jgi:hypothetical protein